MEELLYAGENAIQAISFFFRDEVWRSIQQNLCLGGACGIAAYGVFAQRSGGDGEGKQYDQRSKKSL